MSDAYSTVRYWKPDGSEHTITAGYQAEAIRKAQADDAIRIRTADGSILRIIATEWTWMP